MKSKKLSVLDYCYIGIFTAIIAICAQITVPMPNGVPMTLQTFAIPLAGIVLGARNGMLSALVYMLLGAVGMPVFSNFKGGIDWLIGPTGGFILSFPIMAYTAGFGESKNNKVWLVAGLIAGTVINDICGMAMYSFITSNSLKTAFIACVLPFIPTTVIKMILAVVLGSKIKKALVRSKVLT